MTKVWEETWTGGVSDEPDISGPNGVYGYFDSRGDDDNIETDIARACLAACAPEMARLLLAAEWVEFDGSYTCPFCHASGLRREHYEDCARVALLRKAGIQ